MTFLVCLWPDLVVYVNYCDEQQQEISYPS